MPSNGVIRDERVYHVYQRTKDRGVLFYSVSDYLVYYTIFSQYAREYGVRVLALCQMPDHIHSVIAVRSFPTLSRFIQTCSTAFSKAFNLATAMSGSLFERPFGRAEKKGDKRIRTALAYVYNNPVERKLTARAEQYPWNYLAYGIKVFPFAEPLILRKASYALRMAVRETDAVFRQKGHLSHILLGRLFSALSPTEKRQLANAIIQQWNCIDYETLVNYYGSNEAMLTAFASNTGSEYDIPEHMDPWSDRLYQQMSAILTGKGIVQNPRDVIRMDNDRKFELLRLLSSATMATPLQIGKFLHLPVKYV